MSLPWNIRILYHNAALLLPNGELGDYSLNHWRRPILALNHDETNRIEAARILDSGFYKRMFCDVPRLENMRDKTPNFEHYFNNLFCCKDSRLYHNYENAPDIAAKKLVLGQYYDQCLKNIKMDVAVEKTAAKAGEEAEIRGNVFKTLSGMHKAAGAVSKLPLIGGMGRFIENKIGGLIAQGLENQRQFEQERLDAEDEFIMAFSEMPYYLVEMVEKIGLKVSLPHDISHLISLNENHAGVSMAGSGTIALRRQNITTAISEEIVHQLDSYLSFSSRADWKAAAMADIEKSNAVLDRYYDLVEKSSLLHGGYYQPSDIAPELLADMFCMEHVCYYEPEALREYFPNAYPLYREFVDELQKRAGMTVEENNALEEQQTTTQFRDSVKEGRATLGSVLARGGERTMPTAPRKDWASGE